MAEEALKKLEDQLNCPICLDTYTDPKLLPCHHVYCKKCLVKLVIRDQQGDLVLTCPNCRHVLPVPPNGVAGFPSAFHVNYLLEIQESLQKLRIAPVSVEGAVGGECNSLNVVRKASYCSEHSEKELELYCETCGKLICLQCAIEGSKHYSHDYELLNKAYEKYSKETSLLLEPIERQLTVTRSTLANIAANKRKIIDHQAVIEADIHNTMRRLREILYARETLLVDQLHQMTQAKLKELAVQKDQLEASLAQLSSCLEFMKESLKTGSLGEVLRMKTTIVQQVKELTATDAIEPNFEVFVFSASAKFNEECSNFGQLTLKPLNEFTVVKLPIQIMEGFSQPWGVVISQKGNVIVSDTEKDCIFMLSHAGEHLRSFGTPGSGPGQFNTPYGVAVDAQDNIFVVDSHNHRLQKFNSEGEFLMALGSFGSNPLQFKEPKDIVINPVNGKLYVVEDNCRIQVLNSDLTFFSAFGSRGFGDGQFFYPCGITCDRNGDIYVVDSGNNRIQVFTAEGIFMRQFGSHGDGYGGLDLPVGIAVSSGLVYVSEYSSHRVSVFTCDGKFVVSFGQDGYDHGEFHYPGSLTVQNDYLYVCGRLNPRVQVFSV